MLENLDLRLQQPLQLSSHGIPNFHSRRLAADITGAGSALENVAHGGFDGLGLVESVQRVLQQHCCGEDGSDGVDDSFSGDIWGGA